MSSGARFLEHSYLHLIVGEDIEEAYIPKIQRTAIQCFCIAGAVFGIEILGCPLLFRRRYQPEPHSYQLVFRRSRLMQATLWYTNPGSLLD